MRTRHLIASAFLVCSTALGLACSAAGPITSAVVQALCTFIPLVVTTPQGQVIAGTVCQDVAPQIGPIVSGIVNALGKARLTVMASQMASSSSYVAIVSGGATVAYIDSSIATEVQKQVDALPKDGGK